MSDPKDPTNVIPLRGAKGTDLTAEEMLQQTLAQHPTLDAFILFLYDTVKDDSAPEGLKPRVTIVTHSVTPGDVALAGAQLINAAGTPNWSEAPPDPKPAS